MPGAHDGHADLRGSNLAEKQALLEKDSAETPVPESPRALYGGASRDALSLFHSASCASGSLTVLTGGAQRTISPSRTASGRIERCDGLARALTEIVRRHEALRTRLGLSGRRTGAEILPPSPVPLPLDDLSGIPERDPGN